MTTTNTPTIKETTTPTIKETNIPTIKEDEKIDSFMQSLNAPEEKSIVVAEGIPELSFQGGADKLSLDDLNALRQKGFSSGLAKTLFEDNKTTHTRIWVLDNSGSMKNCDGTEIQEIGEDIAFKKCTRWAELAQCVDYHVAVSGLLKASTTFRLLNRKTRDSARAFSIAKTDLRRPSLKKEIDSARDIMKNTSAFGKTPLVRHVDEIIKQITPIASKLKESGKKVVIILATDGLPTDGIGRNGEKNSGTAFINALRDLEKLPVWIVIRLCTNQENVVTYYGGVDQMLEKPMDVLDDFVSESKEVFKYNKWLNYAMPMHRCREMGYHNRLFDLIDERKLTIDEMREMCDLIFGVEECVNLPDPCVDWEKFLTELDRIMACEKAVYNPATGKVEPWIVMQRLAVDYASTATQGDCNCNIM